MGNVTIDTNTDSNWAINTTVLENQSGTLGILSTYWDLRFLAINATALTATNLAANGANCNAGSYPLGTNESGAEKPVS